MVHDNDDEIIELTDLASDESSEGENQEIIELTEVDTGEDVSEPTDAPLTIEDDISDLGIGDDADKEVDLPEVSQDAFEAALERVIEKKFSESIEKILFEVMEKVIQREIADIKTGLQKDLDDIGSA
ncbi:MAG: hypothetical protein MI892_27985 [Desulfobacterales bacterium]|nr:hypothetical protein [Desulfobacterales bacterium]